MRELALQFQTWLMYVCLAGAGVGGAVLFVAKVMPPVWEKLRSFLSLGRIQQIVVAVFVLGFVQYGATKSLKGRFEGGIKDNGSNITNDTITVKWQRDVSQGVLVPTGADVYIDYRLTGSTQEVWTTLAQTTVGAWEWTGELLNATNYEYAVWAYYIPPEPVHTNGVWLYKTTKSRDEWYAIPLRARVEVNGDAIATPKEVRRDSEK